MKSLATDKTSVIKTISLWMPVVLWSAVIYYFSSIPHLEIKNSAFWNMILRKIAHITEYTILTILYYRAINQNKKPTTFSHNFFPILFSFIYSISDEIHQHFVPGRYSSITDILINSIGLFIGHKIYLQITTKNSKLEN